MRPAVSVYLLPLDSPKPPNPPGGPPPPGPPGPPRPPPPGPRPKPGPPPPGPRRGLLVAGAVVSPNPQVRLMRRLKLNWRNELKALIGITGKPAGGLITKFP